MGESNTLVESSLSWFSVETLGGPPVSKSGPCFKTLQ